MQFNSRLSLPAAVVALAVLSGCGPTWKVLKESNPTALTKQDTVAIAFDYSMLRVGKYSAEEWKAAQREKDANYDTTWDELFKKFEDYFIQGVQQSVPGARAAAEGAADVTITVKPQSMSMGKYVVVARTSTSVNTIVGARAGEGAEDSDEISMMATYPASITQPSVHQHIGHVGQNLGQQTGRFLSGKLPKAQ